MHQTKTHPSAVDRWLATTTLILIAVLAFSGCSRNNNQTTENSCLIQLRTPYAIFKTEPLVVQVSVDPVAYIWQFSDKMRIDNEKYPYGGMPALPSKWEDVYVHAALYKEAQDKNHNFAPLVIAVDDRAKCAAVFAAITNAKRAGITAFVFETFYRESGQTGPLSDWEGRPIGPPRDINPSAKPVTITISANDTIAWENKPGTLYDYIEQLEKIRDEARSGKIRFIVQADAQANGDMLRYALDQIRRAADFDFASCVTVELRELK